MQMTPFDAVAGTLRMLRDPARFVMLLAHDADGGRWQREIPTHLRADSTVSPVPQLLRTVCIVRSLVRGAVGQREDGT